MRLESRAGGAEGPEGTTPIISTQRALCDNQDRPTETGSQGLIRGFVLMILPQVHLRKPCYDFYFL